MSDNEPSSPTVIGTTSDAPLQSNGTTSIVEGKQKAKEVLAASGIDVNK
jgi:hypothetical protein